MIYPRRESSEVPEKEARLFQKKDGNMLVEHVQHWGEKFMNKGQKYSVYLMVHPIPHRRKIFFALLSTFIILFWIYFHCRNKNKKCRFPFILSGVTYHGCLPCWRLKKCRRQEDKKFGDQVNIYSMNWRQLLSLWLCCFCQMLPVLKSLILTFMFM